jgi:hypothetical protein
MSIGKALLNVRFYLPGNCIIQFYRTKAIPNCCSPCVQLVTTLRQDDCTHSDEERCIFGTWVVDEVRQAVEMGYRLQDVYELWKYEVTCFDKDTNSGGLFAEYVNMFLKLKQETSGFPSWVQSEGQKMNISRTTGAQREFL